MADDEEELSRAAKRTSSHGKHHRHRSSRHGRTEEERRPPDLEVLRERRASYYEGGRASQVGYREPLGKGKSRRDDVTSEAGPRAETKQPTLRRSSTRNRKDSVHDFVYPQGEEGCHDGTTSYESTSRKERRHRSHERVDDERERWQQSGISVYAIRTPGKSASSVVEQSIRPVLRRSTTTTSHVKSSAKSESRRAESRKHRKQDTSELSARAADTRPATIPSRKHGTKRSVSSPVVPTLKVVECLTCSSELSPSKTAELACGHRMCHSCLRRIFVLSTTDPACMPPKCCTSDHIPLKHVENLLDDRFKRLWNKKYKEYKTSNRLYCPSKDCGSWIRPSSIHPDTRYPDREYGVCRRCKMKVCASCNNKYHKRRECPDDPETTNFIASAKERGWQQCYSCKAMVELREGCNHMTCRCTAQFCMLCGAKWKSCDCPWFNHSNVVDGDRLQHLRIPYAFNIPAMRRRATDPVALPFRGPDQATTYQQEMDARRQQEHDDEALARRLQNDDMGVLGMMFRAMPNPLDMIQEARQASRASNVANTAAPTNDNTFGVGNSTGHFLNENFVRNASDVVMRAFDQGAVAAAAFSRRGEPSSTTSQSRRSPATAAPPHAQAAAAAAQAAFAETPHLVPPGDAAAPQSSLGAPAAGAGEASGSSLNAAGLKSLGKHKKAEKKTANFGRIIKNGGAAQGAKSERIRGWLANVEPGE